MRGLYLNGEAVFEGRARPIPEEAVTKVVSTDPVEQSILNEIQKYGVYFPESLFKFRLCHKGIWIFAHSVTEILEAIKKKALYDI